MKDRFFDVGESTYFVVPSDPAGFVIIDIRNGSEVVDGDGEVVDGGTPDHCYATEGEAEGAILRWKRREDDREGFRRTLLLFESYERTRVEGPPKA